MKEEAPKPKRKLSEAQKKNFEKLQAANKAVEAARAQRASGWSAAIGGVASAGMAVATGGMSGLGQAALGQEVTPTEDSLFGGM